MYGEHSLLSCNTAGLRINVNNIRMYVLSHTADDLVHFLLQNKRDLRVRFRSVETRTAISNTNVRYELPVDIST